MSYVRAVPRLSEFYGIVIYMYWADHVPPHFHAIYAGQEAQITIEDGAVLAGALREPQPSWCANGRRCGGRS